MKQFGFTGGILGGEVFRFELNPQTYIVEEKPVMAANRTALGGWVDHFGEDWTSISIAGIAKSKGKNGVLRSADDTVAVGGLEEFKKIRETYRNATIRAGEVEIQGGASMDLEKRALQFHDWSSGDAWWVLFERFRLERNAERPLFYQYSIDMLGLLRFGSGRSDPDDMFIVGEIGSTGAAALAREFERGSILTLDSYKPTGRKSARGRLEEEWVRLHMPVSLGGGGQAGWTDVANWSNSEKPPVAIKPATIWADLANKWNYVMEALNREPTPQEWDIVMRGVALDKAEASAAAEKELGQ